MNTLPRLGISEVGVFVDSVITFVISDGQSSAFCHHDWGFGILQYGFPVLFTFVINPELDVGQFFNSQANSGDQGQMDEFANRSTSRFWISLPRWPPEVPL